MTQRRRGFTLVEMMIALALGSVVIVAAFSVYSSFMAQSLRQQSVSEMQESLGVAEQLLIRSLRSAGAGMQGGVVQVNNCGGSTLYYPVQYSNSNVYSDPKITFDSIAGDTETADPDWIRTVNIDISSLVAGMGEDGANTVTSGSSQYQIGDVFTILDNHPDSNPGGGSKCASDAQCGAGQICQSGNCHVLRTSCQRMVTQIDGAGGGGGRHALQHNSGAGNCANLPPGQDACVQAISWPTAVFRSTNAGAIFRIDNVTDPPDPKLMVSYTGPGVTPAWQVAAEYIEDMQFAMVLSNGTICGALGNSVDDPALCDFRKAKAVRYTLVARSRTTVPGFALGTSGNAEDEVQQGPDGYLRRRVTGIVELRNMP